MNRASVSLVAILAIAACANDAPDATGPSTSTTTFRIERTERARDGAPYFVQGTLGVVTAPLRDARDVRDVDAAMAPLLPEIGRAINVPSGQLVISRFEHDELGMTHIRYAQRAHDMPVVDGDVIVHVAADGLVASVTNGARDASSMPTTPQIAASYASDIARAQTPSSVASTPADLVYVIINGDGDLRLAWRTEVTGPMIKDTVFVDALRGEVVARHPHIQPARNREIQSPADTQDQSVQSVVVGTEGSPPTDATAKLAYDNTGTTYDFYKEVFNRDSYDAAGAKLLSFVHVTDNHAPLDNAFWDGTEMVYGDGDGTEFVALAKALDVTAHELTHAVTERSANLRYQNESGALNEASSDILGSSCEAHKAGAVSDNTWKIGEDIYTPNTPGDALRYMNNPTADAPIYMNKISSSDYYPERLKLPAGTNPDNTNDNGFVHFNSGIANLFFYLASQGGPHPRAKTPYNVVGIGIDKASQIWYRALTQYMTATETFDQARTATEMAAMDLFPGVTKTAITMAWATVGVGSAPLDTSPPTVKLTSPTNSSKVNPGFTITADANDDQGVLRVDFTIDGMLVGSSATAPYTFTTKTSIGPGSHEVVAIAYDAINSASDKATVNLVDPTCGNTCTGDQTCDMDTGMCVDKGGCCSTDSGPGGPIALFAGTALLLFGRRRQRRS